MTAQRHLDVRPLNSPVTASVTGSGAGPAAGLSGRC